MRKALIVGKHAANGRRIFDARRRKGFTQTELGIAAGITYRQIIRLENGENLPSGGVRDRLAEALGLPRESIATGDEDEDSELPADLSQALQTLARYVGRQRVEVEA